MGEGFIVRRGGGGQQTVKPIFNSLTSVTFTSLTLSVTNDSNSIATLYYSVVNTDPAPAQAGTFETEFAGKETKDITITGLTAGTTYTVYIKAAAVGEFPSEILIITELTTGVAITATGGTLNTYTSGGKTYRSHTFTGNGTFSVSQLSNISGLNQVEYLICAGGGGGGSDNAGGGGGGGVLASGRNNATPITVNAQNYSIIIGAGGNASGNNNAWANTNGGNSSVFGLTAIGGGRGANGQNVSSANSTNGGSGGGGEGETAINSVGYRLGQPGISGQGFKGGNGGAGSGGGGGGAGAAGANASGSTGGNGGTGFLSTIHGNSRRYGSGGGGSNSSGTGGLAGSYSGGGGRSSSSTGQNASANTGGGGGGGVATSTTGGSGGSGIVVIRYEIAPV